MSHIWGVSGGCEAPSPGLRGQCCAGRPGLRKSTLLVEAAVAHIGAGTDLESVLLLTSSAEWACGPAVMRGDGAAVAHHGRRAAIRRPVVRTVRLRPLAAVLRKAAQRADDALAAAAYQRRAGHIHSGTLLAGVPGGPAPPPPPGLRICGPR